MVDKNIINKLNGIFNEYWFQIDFIQETTTKNCNYMFGMYFVAILFLVQNVFLSMCLLFTYFFNICNVESCYGLAVECRSL